MDDTEVNISGFSQELLWWWWDYLSKGGFSYTCSSPSLSASEANDVGTALAHQDDIWRDIIGYCGGTGGVQVIFQWSYY